MPQLGISEESAVLTQWHVSQGDGVKARDKLFSIETGKSSFDVESEAEGTVLALYAAEGDEVAVGSPVCAIGAKGEQLTVNETPAPSGAYASPPSKREAYVPLPEGDGAVRRQGEGCSPRAKALAEKMGVDPRSATPTGPEGRVVERDVRQLTVNSEQLTVRNEKVCVRYTDQPLSHIRRVIAKNMMASLQNTAQLTHTASFDAANILNCRKRFKEDPAMSGVTLGDMVLYAVCKTLPDFPALNAHLLDDTLRVFADVNLAVAVDTERGLMVPVVFGASGLTLAGLSEQVKTLAGQCKNGSISSDKLSGGSFTVSNLGSFGIESFTPILNAPQTGILGVNTITYRVKADGSSYPAMTLSLTYDHRALDGAPASRFLQALCTYLEQFSFPAEGGEGEKES
jgi:pyruvate dehydrogenase E2 component (dihydrolipoamide acetyltransferase)